MTDREEIIRGLQIERECVSRDCDRDCARCDLVQDRDWLLSVYDGALELLEEQEPKRVKTDMYGNAYCPWCATETTIEMGAHRLHLGTQFCPYCGKGVKWE